MKNEFEIVQPGHLNHVNMVFNKIYYRSPHMHPEFELIYNLGGDTVCDIGSDSIILSKNDFVIVNSNQVHEIRAISPDPFMICLQIDPAFFEDIYPDIHFLEFDDLCPKNDGDSLIPNALIKLSYSYLQQREHYEFGCCALIYTIFEELLVQLSHHIMTDLEKRFSDEKTERIDRILTYAQSHYMEKISLAKLAREENLSLNYLSRFIKVNLNRSFQDYVGELRFQHAKQLIRHSNKNLITICEECGYSDYRYLYQTFMEHCGCSPKEYRRKHPVIVPSATVSSPTSNEKKLSPQEALDLLSKQDIW